MPLTFGSIFFSYSSSGIIASILAFAGGVCLCICIGIVVSGMKALIGSYIACCNSDHPSTPLKMSLPYIEASHPYQDEGDDLPQHCSPCKKLGTRCPIKVQDSSLQISIPLSNYSIQGIDGRNESGYRLTKEYDCATWSMYHRIMSARDNRATCDICFGPMKDNEYTTVVQLGQVLQSTVKGESESDDLNQEEMSLLNVQVHRECYYGGIGGNDYLQFQLD